MILVDIYVPALNEQFEFKLDEHATASDVAGQIGDILSEGYIMEDNRKDLLLCDERKKCVLPWNQTIKQNGIGSGSRLMLI